jgi:prolipoprotein diacylglyceryltransferase/Fe-S-cluster containining protein
MSKYTVRVARPDRASPPRLPAAQALEHRPGIGPFRDWDVESPAPRENATPSAAEPLPRRAPAPVEVVRREVARGLRHSHLRENLNTSELIQIAALAKATREVLEERRIIDGEALERRRTAAVEEFSKEYTSRGMGVRLSQFQGDKYGPYKPAQIDCEARLPLCRAACCRLRFALSRQDVEEGTVRWDFGQPYLIAQGADGYCVHLDRREKSCSIYESRPYTCRGYDCRRDDRIWADFDNRIPHPLLGSPEWPSMLPPPAEPARKLPRAEVEGAPATAPRLQRIIQALADHPVLFAYRGWILSTYGAMLGLAFSLGVFLWLFLVGYRVAGAVPAWPYVAGLPVAAFAGAQLFWRGERWLAARIGPRVGAGRGQSFAGGLLGALAFTVAFFPDRGGLPGLADCAAAPIALGYAVAKLGCLAAGCCIGRQTGSAYAIRYRSFASKAAGYYGFENVPLVPLQLMEALLGLALAILFALLPAQAFGSGRAIGALLVLLALGRSIVLPYRFRLDGDGASPVTAAAFQLLVAGLGLVLLSGWPGTPPAVAARCGVPLWQIAGIALGAGLLTLAVFGIQRSPDDEERISHEPIEIR